MSVTCCTGGIPWGFHPNVFAGEFEGDVLTMTCESPTGHTRLTFDLGREQEYGFSMDMSEDGLSWDTLLVGTYQLQS